jgi:calcium-dependent protein kinase
MKDVFDDDKFNNTKLPSQSLADNYDVGNYNRTNKEMISIVDVEKTAISDFVFQPSLKPKRKVNDVFDLYCISLSEKDILGKGAFGTVRKCKLRSSKTESYTSNPSPELAMKIILKEKIMTSKTYYNLLLDEIKILQTVTHPTIMQILEIIEDSRSFCIVSQIIKGGPIINRLLQHGPMHEGDAKVVVKQILSCLLYLHAKKIVHRDLKLENILFSSKDSSELKIRIIDFGFATEYDRINGMTTILGSPLFMAPELVKREVYDERVDIWALGVLTYIFLTAIQPFGATSVQKINKRTVEKIINFDNIIWSGIS